MMARELIITVYLLAFRIVFSFFKLWPLQKKTTFIVSFGQNVLFTVNELEARTDEQIVILKTANCSMPFREKENRRVLCFKAYAILDWFRSVYHLATSRYVFVDNYFGILSVTNFKKPVRCIQLWHAAGAIKKFGLKDRAIQERPQKAYRRFQKVYKLFDHVVVGSDKMAAIFKESFGITEKEIVRTGIPRTDLFFYHAIVDYCLKGFIRDFPAIKHKKVIFYAPTYRNDMSAAIHLDVDQLYKQFSNDYILFIKLHPSLREGFKNKHPDFMFDVVKYNTNELLLVTDVLITDYSSIPFEFSILGRPMIFYAYDLEEYEQQRGFWEDYETLVPGPIAKNTNEIIQLIRTNSFHLPKIRHFAKEWNTYSHGHSSKNIIDFLYF
ncbi:CDP-glycerol glycerophosphotransferase family protein [Virgibacillus halodenitrificans]|uniref:CDP-glycerol glycerophosphotransferase family protein n=1 Tax=Virgibacillus halodenitrificans TaxID=1482 RepID=UPI002DBFE3EF|nr:CDP-glycerol glycerophosphotransferase family protein [Virgibacillus halodenitrificans]MEC2160909.1 CDP-glycerol glycerophosphotransferase family protein [Virgibacillus halodenitrificans]